MIMYIFFPFSCIYHIHSIQSFLKYFPENNQFSLKHYLDDPMRIYACHGNDPKPASSPPTMRRCAVCLATDMPQPVQSFGCGFFVFFYIESENNDKNVNLI